MKIVMSCLHKTCMYTVSISHQERQYLDNNHTSVSPTHFIQPHLIIIREFVQLQRNYSHFLKKFSLSFKYCKLAQTSIQWGCLYILVHWNSFKSIVCDKITVVLRNIYMLPAYNGQTMTTELNHCVISSISKLVLCFPIACLKLHAQWRYETLMYAVMQWCCSSLCNENSSSWTHLCIVICFLDAHWTTSSLTAA